MSEATEDPRAKRLEAARRLDRSARLMLLALLPTVVLAVVALWLIGDWLIALIAVCMAVAVLANADSLRQTARRMRTQPVAPPRTTVRHAATSSISLIAGFAGIAAVGYLIAGWLLSLAIAVALPIIWMAFLLAYWRRMVRRRRSDA